MKTHAVYKFERIYADEGDAIFRFCLLRVSNREQALDITQETFLRLWQNLYDGKAVENERAYLYTIARHLVIDWYRKKKSLSLESFINKEGEVDYVPIDEKSQDIELETEGRFVLAEINNLAVKFRDPVYLRLVEDLSPGEIGEILNISPNAASVRVNRGVRELRKKLKYESA